MRDTNEAVANGIALGRATPVWGAMLVLVTNVVLVVAASAATLWVQRSNQRRRSA